jgi:DNA-binding transcriptional LysR family regulator
VDNLYAADLNLLVALDALLAERSVTRAAQRLGLSQPAMSNALARLREQLDDAVLVRAGQRMEPTPRALELAGPVERLLQDVRRALARPAPFDPLTSRQRFRIECAHEVELLLLPGLVPRLSRSAPHVELSMARVARGTEEELRTGRVDLYLGTWSKLPASLHEHLLYQESFACIATRRHPRLKSRLTLRAYAELGHVLVQPEERPDAVVDTVLSDQGLGREVVARTADYFSAARTVAESELIATLPRRVATVLAELLPIGVHRPPLDVTGYAVRMIWHARTHDSPPHRWLRAQVMAAVGEGDW